MPKYNTKTVLFVAFFTFQMPIRYATIYKHMHAIIEELKGIKRNLVQLGRHIWAIIRYPYCAARSSWVMWKLLNRRGIVQFKTHRPNYTPVQERIISDLKTQGIALAHIEELFPGESILPTLQEYFRARKDSAKIGSKKTFLRFLLKEINPTLDLDNSFVRLGIRNRALEIISGYLEMWPKLDFYSINVTLPIAPAAEASGSQRWHRDPGDKRICKMFVYVNDVDEDTGPFMAVRFSHEGGKWRTLFPPRADDGWYPPDGGVENSPAKNDILACTGRAGSLVFCDTTMLHKGGYATKKERWMATLSYASKNSFTHPVKYKRPEDLERKISNFSEMQKFAVKN